MDPSYTSPPPLDKIPPEILGSIFRSLPVSDLFRAQHVCKKWAKTIQGGCPELRRSLFLQPSSEEALNPDPDWRQHHNVKSNPLLAKSSITLFETQNGSFPSISCSPYHIHALQAFGSQRLQMSPVWPPFKEIRVVPLSSESAEAHMSFVVKRGGGVRLQDILLEIQRTTAMRGWTISWVPF